MNSLKDGFLLAFSEEMYYTKDLKQKTSKKKSFSRIMPKVKGFYMFFRGDGEDKLFLGYQPDVDNYPLVNDMTSCDIDLSKKVYFFLKGGYGNILVSYHYEGENEYKKCANIDHPINVLKNFYPVLYARSTKGSKFSVKLNSMTFSTEIDNVAISEHESKYDQHLPKLFKKIAFLKNNQEYLNAHQKENTDENLNIP